MKNKSAAMQEPIGPLLIRTARAVGNLLQRILVREGFDITTEQWTILVNLFMHQDGQFQQQLAERTYKDKAAITRLVHGLEKRKLVSRQAATIDRRQKKIFLTEKGKALMQQLFKIAEKAQDRVQQNIAPERLSEFKEVLQQIFNNANEKV